MRIEWIKNDWFSTALIISCERCGAMVYNDVYTFNMTNLQQYKEQNNIIKKKHLVICPKCKKKLR